MRKKGRGRLGINGECANSADGAMYHCVVGRRTGVQGSPRGGGGKSGGWAGCAARAKAADSAGAAVKKGMARGFVAFFCAARCVWSGRGLGGAPRFATSRDEVSRGVQTLRLRERCRPRRGAVRYCIVR